MEGKRPSKLNAFLSHADKDRELAGKLRRLLKDFGIDAFVAHDDLEGGVEWENMLLEGIKKCDIFLILLTKDYHIANFTEQEAGAAVALSKSILPVSINGAESYGFIKRYQNTKMSESLEQEKILKLATNVYNKTFPVARERIDALIERLGSTTSWDSANSIAKLLDQQDNYVDDQVNTLARVIVENKEVQTGFTAKKVVSKILLGHYDRIDPELRKRFERIDISKESSEVEFEKKQIKPQIEVVNYDTEGSGIPNTVALYPNLRNDGSADASNIKIYFKVMDRVVDINRIVMSQREIKSSCLLVPGSLGPGQSVNLHTIDELLRIVWPKQAKPVSVCLWITYDFLGSRHDEVVFDLRFDTNNRAQGRPIRYSSYDIHRAKQD